MIHVKNFKLFESDKKFPDLKKIQFDDFLIYVGKDAKSNDYLTFNIADDTDIWMHVKGFPGSHVVIKTKESTSTNSTNLPTNSVIKYAAELAKKNSKASKNSEVKVVYCKRKFVKKETGMNDGQVKVDYLNAHEIII